MCQEGLPLVAACSSIAHGLVEGLFTAGDKLETTSPFQGTATSQQLEGRPSFARSSSFSKEAIKQNFM